MNIDNTIVYKFIWEILNSFLMLLYMYKNEKLKFEAKKVKKIWITLYISYIWGFYQDKWHKFAIKPWGHGLQSAPVFSGQ